MCTPLEARRCACQSQLCHVHASRWVPYESLYKPWRVRLSLSGRCTIARTNLHTTLLCLYPGHGMHYSSDKHLACGDGTNLDFCEVTAITSDFDVIIITLDSHYSVLSC
jgi:hypothetical protein